MKFTIVFVISLCPLLGFSSPQKEACQAKENSRMAMAVISSNIANLNTTRTPEGGPYLKQELICLDLFCEVKKTSKIVHKFEPDHPDADDSGFVSYPDINLQQEMESMIQATRDFEEAAKSCP